MQTRNWDGITQPLNGKLVWIIENTLSFTHMHCVQR